MYFPKQTLGGGVGRAADDDKVSDGLSPEQSELVRRRGEEFHERSFAGERLVYNSNEPVAVQDLATTLLFSSEFESGNLERAYQVSLIEYDLELASDANARGSTQWFNFSITNAHPATYTFNLVNFVKPSSLYNKGLRPCFYSRKLKKWTSVGENVCYFKNRLPKRDRNNQSCDLYAMSFELELIDPKDVYYLAYCYPFTYTDLQIYLRSLEEASKRQSFYKFKRETLCTTVQGRRCDIVKISKKTKKSKNAEKPEKKYVVISGRVHPGETNASWVVKGMLDFLTSNKVWSMDLLEQYRFVFIPMLNPDGVAIGNYRCDTNGYDLNRCWKTPNEVLHPTIFHVKNYMRKLLSKGEVSLFFDIHGHSRKQNVFAYGNSNARRYRLKSAPKYPHSEKILPLMMSKLCSEFAFDECTFHITRKKEGTARVVNWAELGVPLSYTIEASFLGTSSVGDGNYTIVQYQELGMMLLRAVHEYVNPNQAFVQSVVAELCSIQSGRDSSEMPRCIDLYNISSSASRIDRRQSEVREVEERRKSATPQPAHPDDGHSSCLRPSSAKDSICETPVIKAESENEEDAQSEGRELQEETERFLSERMSEEASGEPCQSHEMYGEYCEEEEEVEESEDDESDECGKDLSVGQGGESEVEGDQVERSDAEEAGKGAEVEAEEAEVDMGYVEDMEVEGVQVMSPHRHEHKADLGALQDALNLEDTMCEDGALEAGLEVDIPTRLSSSVLDKAEAEGNVGVPFSAASDLAPLSSPSVSSVPVSTLFPDTAIVSRDFLGERARHSAEADIDPDESTDSDSSSISAKNTEVAGGTTEAREGSAEARGEEAEEAGPHPLPEADATALPSSSKVVDEEDEELLSDDEGDTGNGETVASSVRDDKKAAPRQARKKAKRKKKKCLQPVVPRSGLVSTLQQRVTTGRVLPLAEKDTDIKVPRGDGGREPTRQLSLDNVVTVGALRRGSRRYASTGSLRSAALPHPPLRLRAGLGLGLGNVQVRPSSSSRPKRAHGQTPAPPAAPITVAAGRTVVTPRTIPPQSKPIRGNMAIARRRS